jgi:SAM-dependent methyltransferase
VDQEVEAPKLSRFYEERADYHEMTASEDKINHPQVRLLLELIRPTDTIVDFGCGGGVALSAAGERAQEAIGIDIGGFALAKANSRPGKHRTIKSDIAKVPLSSDYADIAYSFEVLEHVWDPAAVIREMVRVLKPGGTLLITTPNGFTMNLHLHLRPAVRFIHHLGAAVTLRTSRSPSVLPLARRSYSLFGTQDALECYWLKQAGPRLFLTRLDGHSQHRRPFTPIDQQQRR